MLGQKEVKSEKAIELAIEIEIALSQPRACLEVARSHLAEYRGRLA